MATNTTCVTRNTTVAATRPVVAVDGLTKRYRSTVAVRDLSFQVPVGEVTGLLGPNGAGKTTVMKMLVGLVRPTRGEVALLGASHRSAEFPHAIRRVGSLIETPALYERLTGRQNLELQTRALGINAGTDQVDELLDTVELTDRADDHARTYSLGMKQRLGIAVAMIGAPELVILDEPANGLDPAGIAEIRRLLRRLPAMGITVLVSSHQLAEVQQACDRLIILDRGRLVTEGTTDEILARHRSRDIQVLAGSDDIAAALEVLGENNVLAQRRSDDRMAVTLPEHWTSQDVNRTLAHAGIYASEITAESVSLEAAFLAMTAPDQNENWSQS